MAHVQDLEQTGPGELTQEAIDLAIEGRWEEAIAVNKSIIERFSNDAGAHNRLGRALIELGRYAEAKEAYSKTLEISPNNGIAAKNLARLNRLMGFSNRAEDKQHKVASQVFATEMGKAGVVKVHNRASNHVLGRLCVGARLRLEVKGQRLVVADEHGEYLGEVDPKYAQRLVRLIRGGNRYAAAPLTVGSNEAQVIVREEYKHPSQAAQLSFPTLASRRARHPIREGVTQDMHADENYVPRDTEYLDEPGSMEDEEKALLEGFSVFEDRGDEGGI
jgi:tetratricopeptide (TPR) repeat protein